MSATPSFQEDHISRVPALQLLQNLGYAYLRPQEVYLERRGKLGNVLLEGILADQLRRLNRVRYRGKEQEFTEASIQSAIESHRSVYGETGARLEKVLPKACFIGFTGTPLMRKEKNTARRFGGIILPAHTIDQAVKDKAVVPLLYEGRHALQEVQEKAIDKWFEVTTAELNDAQRADLKRKVSTADQLNKAQSRIYVVAHDIREHYVRNWQGTGFKAQLTAPDKATAIKFKNYLDEFGEVTSGVPISGPDTREGNSDV